MDGTTQNSKENPNPRPKPGGTALSRNEAKTILENLKAIMEAWKIRKSCFFFMNDLIYKNLYSGMVFYGVNTLINIAKSVRVAFPDDKYKQNRKKMIYE